MPQPTTRLVRVTDAMGREADLTVVVRDGAVVVLPPPPGSFSLTPAQAYWFACAVVAASREAG